jgi:Ras family protein T1
MMTKDQVRILVVGDKGVGKTSFVNSYISGNDTQLIPSVLPDTKYFSSNNEVEILIMDSSVENEDNDVLNLKLKLADCVIILYDVNKVDTLYRLQSFWLPKIQSIYNNNINNKMKSVLICGTKVDLHYTNNISNNNSSYNNDCSIEIEKSYLKEILNNYSIVVSCFRTSTKQSINNNNNNSNSTNNISINNNHTNNNNFNDIDNIFFHAENSILYPISLLYNISNSTFTDIAIYCLLRIFRCFNYKCDGLLHDDELNNIQKHCFNDDAFSTEQINELKIKIKKQGELYLNNIENKRNISYKNNNTSNNNNNTTDIQTLKNIQLLKNNLITFDGFLALMGNFLENSQPQIVWIILRKCGYDENLTLHVSLFIF